VNFGEASSSATTAFKVLSSTEATVEGSTGTALASGIVSEKFQYQQSCSQQSEYNHDKHRISIDSTSKKRKQFGEAHQSSPYRRTPKERIQQQQLS
jgi:hypothetical protein